MSEIDTTKITRRQHITREEEADRCLNHTVYSKGSQLMTVLLFLAVVFGVPVAQHVVEIKQNLAKQAEWKPTSGVPKPGLAPQIYDVFKLLPTGEQISQAKGFWGYWDLIPSMDSINAFESTLKQNSVLTTSLLSPTQLFMTKYLGAGNEKAYVGRDGFLFYRPDVEYLTTPGFLEPAQLKQRSHGATEVQPDPVKAILDFKEQLAARGVQLVVMPMPTKPMIVPEMLVGASAEGAALQNDSFQRFQELLEAKGIAVFDPTPGLVKLKGQMKSPLYLQTDTHWTPYAMGQVASKLGKFLHSGFDIGSESRPPYTLRSEQISNLGDIAEMLKLPSGQAVFPVQAVIIEKVIAPDGSPWQPDIKSEVLLLGDSFSNIYSLDGMNWGTAAGFAEHLSYALQEPVDKIVINSGGAFASRHDLASQMARGTDHLAGKKVVVYEFSMRDLAQGDWKMIKLPPAPKVAPPPTVVIKTPTPITSNPLSALKGLTVEPEQLDTSKHQKVKITVTAPPGSWQVSILGADGNSIRRLAGGGATVQHTSTDRWDGNDVNGKPVPPGPYVVQVEGSRPDGSKLDPVTHPVTVIDSSKKATAPVITPPTVKPTTGQTQVKPTIPDKTPTATKPTEEGLFATGRIASRPATPKPGSVPYKDCLIALQLTDLKVTGGTVKGQNIVVYVWGMKDNKLVDGAYSVGQTIRFKLVPWASVMSKYGGYNRQELESDDSLSWEAYWGEIGK